MRRQRGQTLVVMALSLLVMTVLVIMTLAIGQKARDKVELQTLADTSAYSNAVATARAFNTFSLLNRASISHWVSLAGTQALLAWGLSYKAEHYGLAHQLDLMAAQAAAAGGGCYRRVAAELTADAASLRVKGNSLSAMPCGANTYQQCDLNAGAQARDIQQSIVRIEILEAKVYDELFWDVIMTGRYPSQVLSAAGGGVAPPELSMGKTTACRDLCHATHDNDLSAEKFNDLDLQEVNQAWLGSRGYEFTVFGTRDGVLVQPSQLIADVAAEEAAFTRVAQARGLGWYELHPDGEGACTYGSDSSRYSAAPAPPGSLAMHGLDPARRGWEADVAERHDLPRALFHSTCGRTFQSSTPDGAMVISSDLADRNDFHFSSANLGALGRPNPPRTPEHTLQDQGTFVPDDLDQSTAWRVSHPQLKHPGVFRGGYGLIDFNNYPWQGPTPVDASQVWGLPKLPVVIYRDNTLRAQPDPWEAVFSMRLSAAPAAEFDTLHQSSTFSGVADYAVQNAFASGMAYYHRRGHLREPANMLNPFWRATLVPMDINENGRPTPGSSALKNQFLTANHAAQMQAGWRPGDVGMIYMMGSGPTVNRFPGKTVPAWVDVYDKLVNDGQFKGIQ